MFIKIKCKPIFNTREHVCGVSMRQMEKALIQTRKTKNLRYLLIFKDVNSKDVENTKKTSQTLKGS